MTDMVYRLAGLAVLAAVAGNGGGTEDALRELEGKLAEQWAKVNAYSATMIVEANVSASGIGVSTTMTGPLYVQRVEGGRMRSRSELAGKVSIGPLGLLKLDTRVLSVSDGETQYAEQRVRNTVKVVISKPGAENEDGKAPGGGEQKLSELVKRYDLRVLPDEVLDGRALYVLEGRPRTEEDKKGLDVDRVLVYFDQETGIQRKMVLFNPAGETITQVMFENIQLNPQLSPSLFEYTIPEGAEVIDQTK
jgi:outer membrane lipoprotein-sorting protein